VEGARERQQQADRRPAAPAATTTASAPAPAQERVLALQRTAGNRAVTMLMRRGDPPDQTWYRDPHPDPDAAPAPHRPARDERLRRRHGVQAIRTGTEAEQLAELARGLPTGETAPTSIPGWEAWDPGNWHPMYDDIEGAFEDMSRVLGGIPPVREIRFYKRAYAAVAGAAVPRRGVQADFGDGILRIFEAFQGVTWRLPTGRDPDTGPAAALDTPDVHASRRRIIVHELSHGVGERFATPGLAGAEDGFFAHWNAAAAGAGEQAVSAYARTNGGEDFAESVMAYVEAPDVLRARSPGRAAFIDSRRAGWASHLRAPTP
jgi:hypothetical protein